MNLPYRQIFQLHFIVLLSGMIPLVVRAIHLSALEIIFYRTLMAALLLGGILAFKGTLIRFSPLKTLGLLASGLLTSVYWSFFFLSAKLANASVALIGVATTSIWISLLPSMLGRKTFSWLEVLFALVSLVGILILSKVEYPNYYGLLCALAGGFFAALLTLLNAHLGKDIAPEAITFYQMAGAFVGISGFAPLYMYLFSEQLTWHLPHTWQDLLGISALVLIFSIYVYSEFVRLMRTISPFTVTLTSNLTPIYGMAAALLLGGKNEIMPLSFYVGMLLIVGAALAYPLVKMYHRRQLARQAIESVWEEGQQE